ncbi:MAG: M23 family metallopeptidase [Magnetococcus sp. XQGC-1]
MNEMDKMGQHPRPWYIILLYLFGTLLLAGTATPLLAAEIQSGSKQTRLADRAGLMYGIKGSSVHKQRAKRWIARSTGHHPTQKHGGVKKKWSPTARKGAPHTGWHAAAPGKTTRWSSSQHAAHKGRDAASGQVAKSHQGKGWAARKGGNSRKVVAARRLATTRKAWSARKGAAAAGTIFAASVERRMGTFVEPVNGVSSARSSGLFFRVPENADVVAASRGQVVYAGWFRGYGLLTILNHGGRVYSLYGHNRDLLVNKGDFVEPGQVIAKSGKTGSVDGVPGLYFEVRKGNRPENPRRWLVKEKEQGDKMASLM